MGKRIELAGTLERGHRFVETVNRRKVQAVAVIGFVVVGVQRNGSPEFPLCVREIPVVNECNIA
jgi:hypothetical protein